MHLTKKPSGDLPAHWNERQRGIIMQDAKTVGVDEKAITRAEASGQLFYIVKRDYKL